MPRRWASSRYGLSSRAIRRNVSPVEWSEVAELVRSGGIASIATSSVDGRPHVAVVSPAVEGELIWFASNASSGKVRNLRENPEVALMWRPQSEIYLRGVAQLISSPDEKRQLWEAKLFPYDQSGMFGSADNPDLVYVRVEPMSATVMSAGPDGLVRRTWRRSTPTPR